MNVATQQLTAEQAVERIAAVIDLTSRWADRAPGSVWAQVSEVLDIVAPPAPAPCGHIRATNADNGYILCEDCGDWLGVWKIR
jgi:hypothetical protein